MKLLTLSIFIALSSFLSAQNYQFDYHYTFKKDSLSKKKLNEIMTVLVEKDSRFYRSKNQILTDSVGYTVNKKYVDPNDFINLTNGYSSSVDNVTIELDLNTMKKKSWIFTHDKAVINSDNFLFPDWHLNNDTIHYNGLVLKKATSKYLGRNWTAYYTENIPVQIAPYSFYGLPGTIVKLHDENDLFAFELLNYKTKPDINNFFETGISFRRKNDFEQISNKEMFEYGMYLKNNTAQSLIHSGVQLDEEKVKKMEENNKRRKYIFLDPTIPFVL